ncbi:hypothetical protein AYI70_g5844 [Smittium culicis]|uniref:Transcription factor domain-containing protein n=2 Tax=Smittium culicis TaxID=133412 RepID=A0A1R1XPE1_9FUNG|nr:hypothetical protein AYI70_g6593 [Smittium culicis]OMJ17642.1 hypothetical protein AYI70_g5844 [Smittium culicis]
MDLKRHYATRENEDFLEFKRRVWWSYYILAIDIYVMGSGFQIVTLEDIVVNLPKNDFRYKYGSRIKDIDPDIKYLNHLANAINPQSLPPDNYSFIIKMYVLFGNMSRFLNNRWLKNSQNQDTVNLKFIKYINALKKIKVSIDKRYGKFNFTNSTSCHKQLSSFKQHEKVYLLLTTFFIQQTYYSMMILLYQSELVRERKHVLNPERIKAAKIKCIKAALKSLYLYKWVRLNVHYTYDMSTVTIWVFVCPAILLNYKFIKNINPENPFISDFDVMLKQIKLLKKDILTLEYIYYLIKRLGFLKTKHLSENPSECQYIDLLKIYSIDENDLYPWLIPKYSTFLKFECCFESNYTTIDLKDYLFLSDYRHGLDKRGKIDFLINQ